MKEDIHLEVTISGLSRDMFGAVMDFLWDTVQPLFPVITGQWSLAETALIVAPVALLLMVCDGFKYLARKVRQEGVEAATFGTANIHGQSSTKEPQSLNLGKTHTAAAVVPTAPGAVGMAITRTAPFVVPFVCRPFGFVCRMALYYIVICLLIRLWPEVWAVLFGIGA